MTANKKPKKANSKPPMIHKKICDIQEDVGAIGKDGENTTQHYKYRSIEAVCNGVHALLAKHRVYLRPRVVDREQHILDRIKDGVKVGHNVHVLMTVEYSLVAEDGSRETVTVPGEGVDPGDKAAYKAMSMALKYALGQIFSIPTAIDGDEADEPEDEPTPAETFLEDAGHESPANKLRGALQLMSDRDCNKWQLQPADIESLRQQIWDQSKAANVEVALAYLETATLQLILKPDDTVDAVVLVAPVEQTT